MGNGVGKIAGVVSGAALQAIPGIGQIAGTAILAATITAGTTVDAVVERNRQNNEADRNADAQRNQAAAAEAAARQKLAQDAHNKNIKADEQRNQADEQARNNTNAQTNAANQQQAFVQAEQQQLILVINALQACRAGNFDQLPNIFVNMTDPTFDNFRGRALAYCTTANTRNACNQAIATEEDRRYAQNTHRVGAPRP